jgi:hypothetical protein
VGALMIKLDNFSISKAPTIKHDVTVGAFNKSYIKNEHESTHPTFFIKASISLGNKK